MTHFLFKKINNTVRRRTEKIADFIVSRGEIKDTFTKRQFIEVVFRSLSYSNPNDCAVL